MSEHLFRSTALDEPPLPPQYVDRLVAAGRASVRRRRAGAVLCVLALLVAGLALALPGRPPSVPAVPPVPAGSPSLPDRIAPYSTLTSTVSRSPGGRAVMLYQFGNGELFNMFQPLALGADRDTYRQLDAAEGRRGIRPWLLSPDGTIAVVTASVDPVDALTLVDLRTGRRRSVPLPSPTGALPLAFSPDGRTLAYAAVPMPPSDPYADVAGEARRTGVLVLVDLDTGRSSTLSGVTPVLAASFSPDGQLLAVQTGPQVRIVDRAGAAVRTVDLPAEHVLTTNAAWSPDGRLLAATGATASPGGPDIIEYHRRIVFADATGAGGPVPDPLAAEEMLGWRAPDRILAQVAAGDGAGELRDLPVTGGPGTVLSRFDPGSTCELGLSSCQAYEIRMATGLLPSLVVRSADADRGPWPRWTTVTVTAVSVLLALLALLVYRWIRGRRRPRRWVDGGATNPW